MTEEFKVYLTCYVLTRIRERSEAPSGGLQLSSFWVPLMTVYLPSLRDFQGLLEMPGSLRGTQIRSTRDCVCLQTASPDLLGIDAYS